MLNDTNPAGVVYFDNAATTFPKPPEVLQAVNNYLLTIGANPGRSGHSLAIAAGKIVFSCRNAIANFFGLSNPMHVVFTSNATEALNMAISGIAENGCHIITSCMEHNSTIRPLHFLHKLGKIDLSIIPADSGGLCDPHDLKKAIRNNTKAVVFNHVSNVNGCVQPLDEIGKICRDFGLVFIVDAAQSAGIIPINMKKLNIDLLGIPGHKGLYGPVGTGSLLINDEFDISKLKPLKFGGTGSLSDSIEQPEFLPDMLESGTLNVAGISGLTAGVTRIQLEGLSKIRKHKQKLEKYFLEKAAAEINSFKHFNNALSPEVGVISFVLEDKSVSEVAQILSERYKIMCRHGLHCAPLAHQTLGTFPRGTLRFAFSIFNTLEEIEYAVRALKEIANE